MTGPRALFVEDEPGLALTVGDRLRSEGYSVDCAFDGPSGLERASTSDYDLILLDLMLPGLSGFELCRDLRRRGVSTPILILTARDAVADKVRGLKLGGDDYLTKPFDAEELVARCAALLRRAGHGALPAGLQRVGSAEVDLQRAEILRNGQVFALSAKELALLGCLLEHRGETLTRQDLLDRVWGYDPAVSSRTLDVHVVSLRKKLEPRPGRPLHLQTVHGVGYRLVGL